MTHFDTRTGEIGAGRALWRSGLVLLAAALTAVSVARAALTADSRLFNAQTNVVGEGDQAPGLAIGFSVSSTQGNSDTPEDAFGNENGGVEPGSFIFGDGGTADDGNQILGDGGETVDFIEWQTSAPVTIAGYRLVVTEFDPFGRTTELVRFLVGGVEQDFFDNDSATGTPSTRNVVDRPFTAPVTGSTFRIELTRGSNGPRITEIDALIDASEDPQINVNVAGAGSNPMAATETAGAPGVSDDNWLNLAGTNLAAGPIQVLGGDGLPVPGSLASWTGFGQGDGLEDGGGNDDAHMLSSLFDARAHPAVEVTVTGIPFALYDVYAYHQGGAPVGLSRVARFTIGGEDLFSLRRTDTAYVESVSTADLGAATEPGTFVVFRGLTEPDVVLTVGAGSASDGFQRARFAGLQIVEAFPSTTTTSTTTVTSTTTTTVTSTSTTSTTPPAAAELLTGKKLLLKDRTAKPKKRGIGLLSRDPALGLGGGNGSADDPTLHGGTLRIVSTAGDGFDDTYALPADRWRYKGKAGANKGYKFRPTKPIRSVLVKPGATLKVVAKGPELGHSLGAEPASVWAILTLGERRYCMRFGGTTTFKEGKKLLAKDAAAPASCDPTGGVP